MGLSMRQLAERSGLPEASIQDIEIGRRKRGVTVDELMKLASALSIDPAKLLPDLLDYESDSVRHSVRQRVLAELMTQVVMKRAELDRKQADLLQLVQDIQEASRDLERYQGAVESARQGRV